MLRLDIRTKIIILLTISTSTFIVNTLWIEVLCVIILSGMQLAFGKKVFSKWLVFAYIILFFFAQCTLLPLMPTVVEAALSVIVVQFRSMIPLLMGILMIHIKVSQDVKASPFGRGVTAGDGEGKDAEEKI